METFIDNGYRRIEKSEDKRKEVLKTNEAGRLKERPEKEKDNQVWNQET